MPVDCIAYIDPSPGRYRQQETARWAKQSTHKAVEIVPNRTVIGPRRLNKTVNFEQRPAEF